VNKKSLVVSDLNFAIDAAFRLHKIVIAYPQRDIRIITSVKQESPFDGQ
jgi:small-conductance mechanosensitive channel